jgi:hypothetical protein
MSIRAIARAVRTSLPVLPLASPLESPDRSVGDGDAKTGATAGFLRSRFPVSGDDSRGINDSDDDDDDDSAENIFHARG